MNEYRPEEFIKALQKKMKRKYPSCPFCGNEQHASTKTLASILVGEDKELKAVKQTMPSGIIVCENCGHIDFFALGYLDLLGTENDKDEKAKKEAGEY